MTIVNDFVKYNFCFYTVVGVFPGGDFGEYFDGGSCGRLFTGDH